MFELQSIDALNTFNENANIQSDEIFIEANQDREAFWAKQASCIEWFHPFDQVIEWNPPFAKWFLNGKLNVSYNCLDRHLKTETKNKTAIIFESEQGDVKTITYNELHHEVCKFSNVLKSLGLKKGDKVAIYMPMIPEAMIVMLSCTRIGAIHTVVFAGFSAESLRDRIIDSDAKLLITADGGFRRGKITPLKETADAAIKDLEVVEKVIVFKRTDQPVPINEARDLWYHELMQNASSFCPPEEMDAEDELFILYTSGTTGKPKGIVHTTGGYLVSATMTTKLVFDIKPNDIYWCTADIGWITGHTYVTYGPLSNGMTQVIFEGVPDYPHRDRFWKLIEKHKVSILYTAPTVVRTFMKWGEEWLSNADLSSLRLLGSVGEPINPDAWNWYYQNVGKSKCPVVDTWWQTETGSIMIAPIPGFTPLKPGSATKPLPGIDAIVVDDQGNETHSGYLMIKNPWPSMLRGIHKDPKRFEETYWNKVIKGFYFTGDGAKIDQDQFFWLSGRVDDVINISGHRLGTMEVESALISHSQVAESAVIPINDEIRGQAIIAFVSMKEGTVISADLEQDLKTQVVKKIGAIARPEKIIFICELPKTRSGKIMRRLLRDIAEGRVIGDVTSLSDSTVLDKIKTKYQEEKSSN